MTQIDLMIVGAQKAGTTSLKNYLSEHPEINAHIQTEFSFFIKDEEYNKGFDYAYDSQFQKKATANKLIAKNVAMSLSDEGLQRLQEHNPNVKIVFIMREPVERAYSSYTMAVKDGWMKRDFNEVLACIKNKNYDDQLYRFFIKHSYYPEQIERILKYFPASNVLYLRFEDLKENPIKVCEKVFNFLGIRSEFKPHVDIKHNVTKTIKYKGIQKITTKLRNENNLFKKIAKTVLPYKVFNGLSQYIVKANESEKEFPPLAVETKEFLYQHFQSSNKKLEYLTGIKY
jgi:hypothetical protein